MRKNPGLGFLAGGGEMGERMRRHDWLATRIGPAELWPQSLKTSVSICLNSRFPMILWWGPELTVLYNDPYIPMLGHKHPARALGRPGRECWAEAWEVIGPLLESVLETGEANWADDLQLFIDRRGYLEECYFQFSYSPIRDEAGAIAGVFTPVSDTTQKVIAERRLSTLRALAAAGYRAANPAEACETFARVLETDPFDVPFASIYLRDTNADQALLAASVHVPADTTVSPRRVPLDVAAGLLAAAFASGETRQLPSSLIAPPATPPWNAPPSSILVLPLRLPAESAITGWLTLGVSARKVLDADYAGFFDLVAQQSSAALATAVAYEIEHRRADTLLQLDRAKTAFFSNVSHEFRTPLTLMLGPLEDALHDAATPPRLRADLEVAHRNTLRVLKLVNALLDFSRIEAGRSEALFEALDLAELTRDLASTFRSTVEQGGLSLEVDVQPLAEPVYVDREMWERIVLNLLSNAFKYTFEGRIRVALDADGRNVMLRVEDTGIGIQSEHLPKLFTRFYRVPQARGRSHEGSGIGLSLVSELVRQHGGTLRVDSEVGVGSRFTVCVPFGNAHLPPENLGAAPARAARSTRADSFVQEALHWLPDPADAAAPPAGSAGDPHAAVGNADATATATATATVLVVDDNADMRAYLRGLLQRRFNVLTAADGESALATVAHHVPDLVLTDVMMPRLDGFGLLTALRDDPRTRTLPIILLSARAGEDARIEGLAAGADDYLTKPFSAREVIARVESQLHLARLQRQSQAALAAALVEAERRAREVEQAVAERKLTEERLREAHARVQATMAAAEVGAWIWDIPANRVTGDPNLARLYGFTEEESQRGTPADHFAHIHPDDRPVMQDAIAAAFETGRLEIREYRVGVSPDSMRWVMGRGTVAYDADGNPQSVSGLVIDIGERKAMEEALRTADRQKDEFLAMLAHELRNPLAPIRNAGEVLTRILPRESPAQPLVDMIKRQVLQLTRLVDDLLDVSRITQGRIDLQLKPVDVVAVISQALESIGPLLQQKAHRVAVTPPPAPLWVSGDSARLVQCLANVLTNAAKYTAPGGEISVAARDEAGSAVITVTDNGAGIAVEMLPRIFDLFVQSQRTLDRSEGGLGIGLSVVKRLVEMHGGSVEAQSPGIGAGTTFTLRLPIIDDPAVAAAMRPEASPAARRVLIVDDNIDAAQSLAMILQLEGHETLAVGSAEEALAQSTQFKPDVMLLDIGLPGVDGYELARRLRARPRSADVRLIALTGYGREEDRLRAERAGFDDHLVKPVDLARLARSLG